MVDFVGFVPHSKMPNYYSTSDLLVNLAPTGGLDKVVLEAMASGLPVIVSNLAFKKYLNPYEDKLIFEYGDSENIAEKIINFVKQENKEELSHTLAEAVDSHHNLKSLIAKISNMFYV